MYTLGALLLLALVLSSVTNVVDSILGTVGLAGVIKKLPIIGANWNLIVSILLVWAIHSMSNGLSIAWLDSIAVAMTEGEKTTRSLGLDEWLTVVVYGAVVYGMVPVKDAVVSMVGKGLRA